MDNLPSNNKKTFLSSLTAKIILALIIFVMVIGFILLGLFGCFPYPDFYIKSTCKDKHFSCEQNMSIECRCFGMCIN